MQKKLYQVYDLIAEMAVGPVIVDFRDNPAVRTFIMVLEDKNTQLGQRPQDYELRYIGDLNEATSAVTVPPGCPQTIATGRAWVAEREGK